jgi:hypothetical protein
MTGRRSQWSRLRGDESVVRVVASRSRGTCREEFAHQQLRVVS